MSLAFWLKPGDENKTAVVDGSVDEVFFDVLKYFESFQSRIYLLTRADI